jgi:CheY-like chemotaxis protein
MSLRCLVVDDNPGFLKTASSVLRNDDVSVVAVASTSAEAVSLVEQTHPDVVLIDIMLGSESGFVLARQLAAGPPPTPKLILTSTQSEEDLWELTVESPAVGFLPKWQLSAAAIMDLIADRECQPPPI